MDVRMPDGTIIRGVPEGTPKEAILAKYNASRKKPSPEISAIDEEIERRRQRLERGRVALSKEPEGLAAAAESVLNFLGSKSGRQESLERLTEEETAAIEALRRRQEYIKRTGQAPRELTTGEKVLEVAKGAPRAVIRGVADIGGGLGVFGRPGEAAARKVAELGEAGVEALGLTPDELAQYDPSLVRPTQFSEALGSTVPLVAAQFLGRAAKPVQIALAGGMGAAEQRRGIEAQEAATGQPVSALDRALAQAGGFGVNLAELAPIPGLVAPRGGRALQRIGRSAVEEGGQEAGTQAAQNVVEALTYNPEQEISEGALESALLGGTVGGTIRGGTELVTRGAGAPEPEVQPERRINVTSEADTTTGQYRTVVDVDGEQQIYDEPFRADMITGALAQKPESRTVIDINGEQTVYENGQIVPRETLEPAAEQVQAVEEEAPPVPTTAFGEEGAAEPVSERPFPTVSRDTADIEAPPTGFEPERSTPSEVPPATPIKFDTSKETFKQKAGRLLSDDMQRLSDIEESISAQRGAPLPKDKSARDAFARYFGRSTERLDEIDRDFTNPIIKKIGDYGLPQERVNEYLVAKSAPARNEMIARINPEMPDSGAGMSNAEADDIIRAAEDEGIAEQLEDVAGDVYTMAKATREGMVRDGLITREQADVWEKTQPYYVPLKGIAAGGDMAVSEEDTPHYDFNPAGFRARLKESKSAKGRGEKNLPLSPLAYTIYDAKAATIRGEKNVAANKLLDLVLENPSNVWQVFTKENPDTELVPDPKTGVLRRQAVPMQMRGDQYFLVKREGKPYYIRINDPLLMRALTNGGAKSTQALVDILNKTKIAPATRTMARLFTTYNPVFAGVNYIRDMQSAIFNILAEQDRVDGRLAGKEIAGGVLRDMVSPSNIRKIWRVTFNKEATTAEERQMFDMFQQAKEDGAFTGWIVNEPVQQKIDEIEAALDKASAKGGKKVWYETKEGAEKVLQSLQDFNSVFENITRFSVYKNALEAGLTREEAASMAREVTVDFNKKGEVGSVASALYAFVNASIQGNTRLFRSMMGRKADGGLTRAQKLAITLMGMGAIQAIGARALSDDDEDGKSFYDKIPEYEKQRNIIIPHWSTGGETYTKIPLPYGISVFYNFGTNAADMAMGEATPVDLSVKTLSSIMNNFSPISVGFNSAPGFFNSFAPTAVKPLTDLMINENYFGSSIYNEPFREGDALSNVPRYNTPEGYKTAVKFLNEMTGGQGAIKGAVDVPAEAVPYLLNQYTGGAGRFASEVIGLAKNAGTGEFDKISPNDIPYAEYALSEVTEKSGLGDYYDRVTKMGPIERQLKDSSGPDRQRLLKKYPVETNGSVVRAKEVAASRIKELNEDLKRLKEAPSSDVRDQRIDRINELKNDAIMNFNRTYNRVEERAR